MRRLALRCACPALGAAAVAASLGSAAASAGTGNGVVRVAKGDPVQIAVVVDTLSPAAGYLGVGIRNAVEMAAQQRTIRRFPVQLNVIESPAFVADDPDAVADNAATARLVVANRQNVAVIGHEASLTFGGVQPPDDTCPSPASDNALATYESYGIVTINGSTTNPCLPPIGPTVFNGTAVPGDAFAAWYQSIQALPSDTAWRLAYQGQFAISATDFADLYFDAANVLLDRLGSVAKIANGNLVISRSALAEAVRATTGFCGVTGTLSLDTTGYRVNAPGPC